MVQYMVYELCYVLSARCTTAVTGLGATYTYGVRHYMLLPLLMLLAVCSCVVADSREGKNNWTEVVQRAKVRIG